MVQRILSAPLARILNTFQEDQDTVIEECYARFVLLLWNTVYVRTVCKRRVNKFPKNLGATLNARHQRGDMKNLPCS